MLSGKLIQALRVIAFKGFECGVPGGLPDSDGGLIKRNDQIRGALTSSRRLTLLILKNMRSLRRFPFAASTLGVKGLPRVDPARAAVRLLFKLGRLGGQHVERVDVDDGPAAVPVKAAKLNGLFKNKGGW